MADAATDLSQLAVPVPVPAPLGEGYKPTIDLSSYVGGFDPAAQAMAGSLSGGGTSDTSGDPNALPVQLPFSDMPMFAQEDISNVGGVTSLAPPEDTAAVIPQLATEVAAEERVEEQATEFREAEEGFQRTTKSGRIKKKVHEGKKGARKARKQDIKEDKWARKEAGLKGEDKREMRRAQRQERRGGWRQYKGKRDFGAENRSKYREKTGQVERSWTQLDEVL